MYQSNSLLLNLKDLSILLLSVLDRVGHPAPILLAVGTNDYPDGLGGSLFKGINVDLFITGELSHVSQDHYQYWS